jgi:photosystem II stability/assembly factor-like uncharacterized protein
MIRKASSVTLTSAVLLFQAALAATPDVRWAPLGADGGAVNAVTAGGDGMVYAATTTGGTFRSTDAGDSWEPAFGSGADLPVAELAVDPADPAVAVAAGLSLYRTVDRGVHWTLTGAFAASVLARSPSAPAVLYAGHEDLYKSVDGGATWSRIAKAPERLEALAVDAGDPRALYAGTWTGFFRSLDGGVSWTLSNEGLRTSIADCRPIRKLAADPRRPGTVWAGTVLGGLFRSADQGATWIPVSPHLGSSMTVSALRIDPRSGAVYAGFQDATAPENGGVFKISNGGGAWTRVLAEDAIADLAVDLAGHIYAGGGRGCLRSADGGATWIPINRGLRALAAFDVEIDRGSGRVFVLAGTLHPGKRSLLATSDDGRHWDWILGPPDESAYLNDVALHPARPGVIYAAYRGGVLRSLNGGKSWRSSNQGLRPGEWVQAVVSAAANPGLLYALGLGKSPFTDAFDNSPKLVYRSTDGGAHWIAPPSPIPAKNPAILAVDPLRPDTVYAGGRQPLCKSTNGGWSWRTVGQGLRGNLWALAIAPSQPDRLYAATYGEAGAGLFRSTDGGETWTAAGEGIPQPVMIRRLVVDPGSPAVVYAATEHGVYETRDGGGRWTPLPNSQAHLAQSLALDPLHPGTIYAATVGGGGLFVSSR